MAWYQNKRPLALCSYKHRLRSNRAQAAALNAMLRDFCGLYNAGLQQRVEAYRRQRVSLGYAQQASELKACRVDDPEGLGRWSFTAWPIHDAAWSLLVQFVRFKAESAGAEIVLVDPRGTSQTCPDCCTIKAKTLRERLHRCTCGCTLDRDVAAAKIVHQRAFPGQDIGLQDTSQRFAA